MANDVVLPDELAQLIDRVNNSPYMPSKSGYIPLRNLADELANYIVILANRIVELETDIAIIKKDADGYSAALHRISKSNKNDANVNIANAALLVGVGK